MTLQTPSEFPNPSYWQQMTAWIALVLIAVEHDFSVWMLFPAIINGQPNPQVMSFPFTDSLTGLSTFQMFQVYCVPLGGYCYITASQYAAFMNDPAGFAAALVTQMYNSAGQHPPARLPAPPPPPPPPPPTNPIGEAYSQDGGFTFLYQDRNSTYPINSTYTNTDPSVAPVGTYTKHGMRWMMGTKVWWTLNSAAA